MSMKDHLVYVLEGCKLFCGTDRMIHPIVLLPRSGKMMCVHLESPKHSLIPFWMKKIHYIYIIHSLLLFTSFSLSQPLTRARVIRSKNHSFNSLTNLIIFPGTAMHKTSSHTPGGWGHDIPYPQQQPPRPPTVVVAPSLPRAPYPAVVAVVRS